LNIKPPLTIHPFLFAAFPVLFLFARNMRELQISVVIIPITIVLIFTSVVFVLAKLILKDALKTAILLSFLLVLFFSYGPFSHIIQDFRLSAGNFVIGPHKAFLIVGGILFCVGARFIIKTRNSLHNLTKIMNVMASCLILIPSFSICIDMYANRRVGIDGRSGTRARTNEMVLGKTTKLPNIYYIILDGYGRADILRDVYSYDNGEFINYLRQKGFYIADKSTSNYQSTFASLSSSLNISYLDPADGFQAKKYSNSRVFSMMKQLGYTTVFASSLGWDVRMSNADFNLRIGWVGDFEYKLIHFTPIPELLRRLQLSLGSYRRHRDGIHFTFDKVTDTTQWNSPVFVYAHIFSPHPPFVFGPNGENIQPNRKYSVDDAKDFFTEGGTQDEYINGYREQIQYINKRLITLINHILSIKDTFSVIILQADHGPRLMADWSNLDRTDLRECYSIFNAYYLPNNGNKMLYESITPVNTFRLVFNLYFGGSYDLLGDKNYFYNPLLSPAVIDVTSAIRRKPPPDSD